MYTRRSHERFVGPSRLGLPQNTCTFTCTCVSPTCTCNNTSCSLTAPAPTPTHLHLYLYLYLCIHSVLLLLCSVLFCWSLHGQPCQMLRVMARKCCCRKRIRNLILILLPRLASATATAGQQEQQRVVELRLRLSWDRVGVGTFQRAAYKLINKVPKKFSCGQSRECLTRKTLCTHAGECKFCTQCERTEKESTMNESQWGNTWGPSRAFDRFKFPHLFANSCTRNSFDSNSKTIFGTLKLTVNQMKLG